MTKTVAQGVFGALTLIALAVGDIDFAYATSDKKLATRVGEPAVAKFPPPPPPAMTQTPRVEEPAAQAKPVRSIVPQTPPPARTMRPASPLPPGPIAIVTIPPSMPASKPIETKSEPVKQASAVVASKSVANPDTKRLDAKKAGLNKSEPKKLVQPKPAR